MVLKEKRGVKLIANKRNSKQHVFVLELRYTIRKGFNMHCWINLGIFYRWLKQTSLLRLTNSDHKFKCLWKVLKLPGCAVQVQIYVY